MTKREFLIQLRETFRARMNEVDFCIGEKQVEKLFQELLNEPEKPKVFFSGVGLKTEEVSAIMVESYSQKLKGMFEADNSFLKLVK